MKKIDKSRLIACKDEHILVLEKIGLKKQYALAGGIKKKKESDKSALIREVFEEIGCLLRKKELSYFISRKNITKEESEVYKHYFITTKTIKNTTVLEPHKFKNVLWIPWHQALEYLDKEDRIAVSLYYNTLNKKVN